MMSKCQNGASLRVTPIVVTHVRIWFIDYVSKIQIVYDITVVLVEQKWKEFLRWAADHSENCAKGITVSLIALIKL